MVYSKEALKDAFPIIYLFLLLFSMPVYADTTDINKDNENSGKVNLGDYSFSCDKKQGIVEISTGNLPYQSNAPEKVMSLIATPKYIDKKPPLTVCNFSKNITVTVKGGISSEHPTRNNITVNVGGRVLKKIFIELLSQYYLIIHSNDSNNYVDVTECMDEEECVNENNFLNPWFDCKNTHHIDDKMCLTTRKFAIPSFDCSKAKPGLDSYICNTESLSEADRKMTNAFIKANKYSINITGLLEDQRTWLKNRKIICKDSLVVQQDINNKLSCLESLYKSRTEELEKIAQQNKTGEKK